MNQDMPMNDILAILEESGSLALLLPSLDNVGIGALSTTAFLKTVPVSGNLARNLRMALPEFGAKSTRRQIKRAPKARHPRVLGRRKSALVRPLSPMKTTSGRRVPGVMGVSKVEIGIDSFWESVFLGTFDI